MPPDASDDERRRFAAVIDDALARGWPRRACIGRPGLCPPRRGDPEPVVPPMPRLNLVLDGHLRFTVRGAAGREEVRLGPGEALYRAANAWALKHPGRGRSFGLAFASGYWRYLIVERGGAAATAIHVAPATAAVRALTHALDAIEESESDEATIDLTRALLRLARRHLVDRARAQPLPHARRTWLGVIDHLQEHYAESIGRAQTAAALGLHPNYLSALCREQGGRTFHATLRGIRLERARHLLATSEMAVAEVGRACGFPSAAHFARVFAAEHGCAPTRFRDGERSPRRRARSIILP